MKDQSVDSLLLVVESHRITAFYPLLQQGFTLRGKVGCSVKSVLTENLKLTSTYIEERIKTIFLNGKPVDDIESATVKDGARLTLSAAMPGLVGATFRRGGVLAPFRSSISYAGSSQLEPRQKGTFTVKLFNLLLGELGPGLLAQGIGVGMDDLKAFFSQRTADFLQSIRTIQVDGKSVRLKALSDMPWGEGKRLIELKVIPTSN